MAFRDRLRSLHRRRWLAAGLILVLIAVAGVLASMGGGDQNRPDSTEPTAAPVPITALPGGFDGTSPTARGWTVDAAGGARAEIGSGTVHSGKGALRLDTSGTQGSVTVRSRPQRVVPGQEYGASGFALVASGRPVLRLEFLDPTNRVVDSLVANASDKVGAWSRTLLEGAAPNGASHARVVVAMGADAASIWDDLDWWTTALPDAGFEEPGPAGAQAARSWTTSDTDGTTVLRVTAGAHAGTAALELRDTSEEAGALASSALTPASRGSELEVGAWVRATQGESTLRVRWFDGGRVPLKRAPANGAIAKGSAWAQLSYRVPVPDGAAYAQAQVVTSANGQAVSTWDDVSLRPVSAAKEQGYAVSEAATMKGFANTKTSLITSVGGVPKFSTVVSGSPAVFQLADLRTGKVEYSHEIPGILNGWALTHSHDQRVIFIGGQGHVWRYDTATKALKDLGPATPRATRVFDLVTAPDGRIWGGSYPGGEVWSLDPRSGKFTSAGSVGNDNDYARSVAVDAKNVYVGTGSVKPNIVQISMADPSQRTQIAAPNLVRTGFLTQLKVHGGFLSAIFPDGERGLYDLGRRAWVSAPELNATGTLYQLRAGTTAPDTTAYFFRDGKFWGATLGTEGLAETALATVPIPTNVNGTVVRMRLDGEVADWVVSHDGHTSVVVLKLRPRNPATALATLVGPPRVLTIGLRPTALRIKSLAARADKVVVGGYGGSSMSVLDPATLGSARSPGLVRVVGGASTPKYFGEIEGMITNGRYQYFGTYPKSRIFRMDITQPWKDRSNPRLLVDLGADTDADRPIAWAASGFRTFFGTIPEYGLRGGVLGWFDGSATAPVVIDPPVPDQSVVALSTNRSIVYGSTSRWGGLGARPSAGPPSVFAYDSDRRRLLWTVTPDRAAQAVGSVLFDDEGRLWAASRNRLFQLDPVTGRTIRTIALGITGDPAAGNPDDGDPANATFVSTALVSLRGHLFLASGGEVWQIDPGTSQVGRISDGGVSPSRLAVVGNDLYFPRTTVLMRAVPR